MGKVEKTSFIVIIIVTPACNGHVDQNFNERV